MNRDPIGYAGASWNLYEYIDSSPTDGLDPSGLIRKIIPWYGSGDKTPVVIITIDMNVDNNCEVDHDDNPFCGIEGEEPCDDKCLGDTWPAFVFSIVHKGNNKEAFHYADDYEVTVCGTTQALTKGKTGTIYFAKIDCLGKGSASCEGGKAGGQIIFSKKKSKNKAAKAVLVVGYEYKVKCCGKVSKEKLTAKIGPGDIEDHSVTLPEDRK